MREEWSSRVIEADQLDRDVFKKRLGINHPTYLDILMNAKTFHRWRKYLEESGRSTERTSGPAACSGIIDGGIGDGNDASLE